jgi:hypothetical protein
MMEMLLDSGSHSSMSRLMLPKLCQQNIKDTEGKGTTVDQPTVAVAKDWVLK